MAPAPRAFRRLAFSKGGMHCMYQGEQPFDKTPWAFPRFSMGRGSGDSCTKTQGWLRTVRERPDLGASEDPTQAQAKQAAQQQSKA